MDGPMGGKHLAEYMPSSKRLKRSEAHNLIRRSSPILIEGSLEESYHQSKSQSLIKADVVFDYHGNNGRQVVKTATSPDKITKKVYEKKRKREEGHQKWQSSNKMYYLRLSKGKRKPTGQELTDSVRQISEHH